jgi:hypothetical protein
LLLNAEAMRTPFKMLGLLLLVSGCQSPEPVPGPWIDVQMNDVSVLFPLAAGAAELASGYLSPASSGARGPLLPEGLYDALGHIMGTSGNPPPGGVGEARYQDLRVVALRLDPCFAKLAPDPHGAGCDNQLRLIVQEVVDRQGVLAADSAMHLFYSLTRPELESLAQSIATLRVARAGNARLGGLGPHPVIVTEGLAGPMATGLRELILQYAGADKLTRVTKMSASQPGFAWEFSGFDVLDARAKTITAMKVPTLPGAATEQTFFRGFAVEMEGTFTPSTAGSDDFTPLADVQRASQLDAAARATAFGALVRSENPSRHSPDTIDCASCHLATPVALLVAKPKFSLLTMGHPDAFKTDELPTYDTQGEFNVHAFSYIGRQAGINQRTVNETAAVIAYLNAGR